MNIDQAGLDFIEQMEGCKLSVYDDVAGKPTIGIGHLILPGEDFSKGITRQQALDLLAKDVAPVVECVNEHAPWANQNQCNALCSFGYNLGCSSLVTMLSHGRENVPAQMPRWNRAGGVEVPGLSRRRAAEVALFLS